MTNATSAPCTSTILLEDEIKGSHNLDDDITVSLYVDVALSNFLYAKVLKWSGGRNGHSARFTARWSDKEAISSRFEKERCWATASLDFLFGIKMTATKKTAYLPGPGGPGR